MRKFLVAIFVLGLGFCNESRGQAALDTVQLRNMKGKMVPFSTVKGDGKIFLVCFWSMNSEASMQELTAINQRYMKLKQPAGFTVLALCVDQGSQLSRMRNVALQNEWAFQVYADVDGELQRAWHFSAPPHSMVIEKGEVVYQQSGFQPGTESYLFSKLSSLGTGH